MEIIPREKDMIYKTSFTVFLLLLLFSFWGCGNLKEQKNETVYEEIEELSATISGSGALMEKDILDAFFSLNKDSGADWKISMMKETENIVAAFLVPKDMPQVLVGDSVQINADMTKEQYLVFYNTSEKKFSCLPLKERGISQLCFFEEDGSLYIGIIYELSFAGWEEYSMKWLCYENSMIKRLWNKTEGGDSYHYWKNRKPVFAGNGTISIFQRKSPEETFDELMQNCELMAIDHYSDYVQEYQWIKEEEFHIAEWIFGGAFGEDKVVFKEKDFWKEGCNLTGVELVSMLFDMEKTETLPNPIYFSVGFDGAAVKMYGNSKEGDFTGMYFVVKKYSASHAAGFQTLYIGSLDVKQGKITQCLEYSGDHSAAEFVSDGEQQGILFYAESVSNGIPTTIGGILRAGEGKLSMVWPDKAGTDGSVCEGYWHPCGCGKEEDGIKAAGDVPIHRTARLENERLRIYRIDFIFCEDSPMVTGYNLVFEEEIGIGCTGEIEKDF